MVNGNELLNNQGVNLVSGIDHMKVAVIAVSQGSQECGRYKARVPRNTGGVYADIRRGFLRGDNAVDAVLWRTA